MVSNGIFATLDENDDHYFSLRDVRPITIHLGRIDATNTLSRTIAQYPDRDRLPEYNAFESGITKGVDTLKIAGAIVLGILFGLALPARMFQWADSSARKK